MLYSGASLPQTLPTETPAKAIQSYPFAAPKGLLAGFVPSHFANRDITLTFLMALLHAAITEVNLEKGKLSERYHGQAFNDYRRSILLLLKIMQHFLLCF